MTTVRSAIAMAIAADHAWHAAKKTGNLRAITAAAHYQNAAMAVMQAAAAEAVMPTHLSVINTDGAIAVFNADTGEAVGDTQSNGTTPGG